MHRESRDSQDFQKVLAVPAFSCWLHHARALSPLWTCLRIGRPTDRRTDLGDAIAFYENLDRTSQPVGHTIEQLAALRHRGSHIKTYCHLASYPARPVP